MLLDKWSPAGCGRLTGIAVGFDFPGFYTKRIELGGAGGRRDAWWKGRQTFPRQAARCAAAHRPQIHGAPCSCLTPPVAWRPRVPRSQSRPVCCHRRSEGVVARCRSANTWPMGFRIGDAVVGLEIPLFVLDAFPLALDKDVVTGLALSPIGSRNALRLFSRQDPWPSMLIRRSCAFKRLVFNCMG